MNTTAPPMSVRLGLFSYDRKRKCLVAKASTLGIRPGGFPSVVRVNSHHTGRTVEWVLDRAKAERNEWWDGMEAHYMTFEPRVNAQTLIILND